MRELTRRDALTSATALGAVVLAGCVADDDEDPADTDDDTGDDGADDNPEDTDDTGEAGDEPDLDLVDTELTTVGSDCGDGDLVEATVEGGDVVLEGTVPAADPCHEAVLDEATLEDGALSVAVGVEEDLPEDGTCAQCTAVIDYEATLQFSAEIEDLSAFASVTVEHGGRSGETHTIEEAGTVAGSADRAEEEEDTEEVVLAHSIVTTGNDCTSGGGGGDDGPQRIDASDETEFSQTNGTVTVEGSVRASNPCHEAVIENVSYSDGTLSVVVDVQATEDEQACIQCIANIHYEATVEVAEGTVVDDVSVTHIQATG